MQARPIKNCSPKKYNFFILINERFVMRKVALFTMIALLLSSPVLSQTAVKDGDPGYYWGFLLGDEGLVAEVIPGEVWSDEIMPVNWGAGSGCGNPLALDPYGDGYCDTICMDLSDKGVIPWTLSTDWPSAWDLSYVPGLQADQTWMMSGYYWPCVITVEIPCTGVTVGMVDTIWATMGFVNADFDCEYIGSACPTGFYGDAGMVVYQAFEVVAPPPSVTIYQDSLYYIEEGLASGYIPFGIANDNFCFPLSNFDYVITSKGHVGPTINDSGSGSVAAGELVTVYTIMDASGATACDYDTLTIIAWNASAGDYDTCVQIIHVIEPAAVPLFTAPVVTIMVLAMILAAAVIMRRHAVSKA
jgi:hypothetical protein